MAPDTPTADTAPDPLAAAVARFTASIYREHFEEASFLYEQGEFVRNSPSQAWVNAEVAERRLAERLRAIAWGGDDALALATDRLELGDVGEQHAAVRLLCRHGDVDLLVEALQAVAEPNRGVRDGLCLQSGGRWQGPLMRALIAGDPGLWPAAAMLAGFQQLPVRKWLRRVLDERAPGMVQALWALGRLRITAAAPYVAGLLADDDPEIAGGAAHTLAVLGEGRTVGALVSRCPEAQWALQPLALAGGPLVAQRLGAMVERGDASAELLLAVGMLGEPGAVPALLRVLENEDLAPAAAQALWLITGAEPLVTEREPEPVRESDLFDDEIEAYRQGELPPHPGVMVTRLSLNGQVWREMWQQRQGDFTIGGRYRFGQPHSPQMALATLAAPRSPRRLRQWAYDELRARFGARFFFDTLLPVAHQRHAINGAQTWAAAQGQRFARGGWYLGGREMAS